MEKMLMITVAIICNLLCFADVQAAELELLKDSSDYEEVLNRRSMKMGQKAMSGHAAQFMDGTKADKQHRRR
ncbi:MAG: hypothetical protein PHS82_16650 [Lachnospiraceae bacterium]|nr:hypothetical protein [Lachnospiraceae bacterium]